MPVDERDWYEFAFYRRYPKHPWHKRHIVDKREREAAATAKKEAFHTTPFYNKRANPAVGTRAEKARDLTSVPKTERAR